MKLQTKISILMFIGIILSTIFSFLLIKISIIFFDKSYTTTDIEKIAADITKQISELKEYNIQDLKKDHISIQIRPFEFQFFNN